MDTAAVLAPPAVSPVADDKPALHFTERAIAQVKDVIASQGYQGYILTVRVEPAGCSGLGYDLQLLPNSKPTDVSWVQDGVTIATDKMSLSYLKGTQVDYLTGQMGAGFKFDNPNAKSSCGCGSSFSV